MAYKLPFKDYCKAPAFQAPVSLDNIDKSRFAGLNVKLAHTKRVAKNHPDWIPGNPCLYPNEDPYATTLRDKLVGIAGDSAEIEDRSYRTPEYLDSSCILLYGDCVLHIRMGTERDDVETFSICSCNPGTKRFHGYALDVYGSWHPYEAALVEGPGYTYLVIDTSIDRHSAYYGKIEDFEINF